MEISARSFRGVLGLVLVLFSLWALGSALQPLLLAFCLAYLWAPLILFIEKRGLPRLWALVIGFVLGLLPFVLGAVLLLPRLGAELKDLQSNFPQLVERLLTQLHLWALDFGVELPGNQEELVLYMKDHAADWISSSFQSILGVALAGIGSFTQGILVVLNFLLVPIFYVYLILEYEKVLHFLSTWIPENRKHQWNLIVQSFNEIFGRYFRGQFLVATFLAVFYSVGLQILGVKYGLLIGILGGLLSAIPYVGFLVTFGASMLMIFISFSWALLLKALILFSIAQFFESFVITPKVVGKSLGLSGLATMLILIMGGNAAGLLGMFFSLPLAALIYQLYKRRNEITASV